MHLDDYLARQRADIDRALDTLLPPATGPAATIAEAMRYAALGPGKRLRPVLVLSAHEACRGEGPPPLEPACALEFIHAYSLIHDDLPAMDDDDLRRGRPTVHRAFTEAVAVLAGDALLTLAFGVLAGRPEGDGVAAVRAEAVAVAARAAGIAGMVGGQIADLEAERREVGVDALRWIHRHKTGALFAASCEIGAIHARAGRRQRDAMSRYGLAIGLAFQIADDLLDRTAGRDALGKTPGKDERAGKATYPALLGDAASRDEAENLVGDAIERLHEADLWTEPLAELARHAVARAR